MMMDLDDYGDQSPSCQPLLPGVHQDHNSNMEDCCAKSVESRSTSSFVSASSTPYVGDEGPPSPLLPSVLPPPEFFSLKWSPAPSSSLWLYPMGGSALSDRNSSSMLPLLPSQKSPPLPSSLPVRTGGSRGANNSFYSDDLSYNDSHLVASTHSAATSTTTTLALLDLRGSQRLTDRGLLQLSSLSSLEIAKLDNCHGITGKGLLAFSRSHRLHTLSLANCRRLTDEAVVNVSHLVSLEALILGGCRCLTDRSLDALSALINLTKLDLSQVRSILSFVLCIAKFIPHILWCFKTISIISVISSQMMA